MTRHVVFIHGAGEGAYKADKLLADNLQHELGSTYKVDFLRMQDEENAPYDTWKDQVESTLAAIDSPVTLVGHSIGGSHLLKVLTEIKISTPISGVFILDAPFWGGVGWQYEGYKELELPNDTSVKLPEYIKLFLYHATDDEIVPFEHLNLYTELIPQAVPRTINTGGHQLDNDLSVVARDILKM
jgi:hypothetical protein